MEKSSTIYNPTRFDQLENKNHIFNDCRDVAREAHQSFFDFLKCKEGYKEDQYELYIYAYKAMMLFFNPQKKTSDYCVSLMQKYCSQNGILPNEYHKWLYNIGIPKHGDLINRSKWQNITDICGKIVCKMWKNANILEVEAEKLKIDIFNPDNFDKLCEIYAKTVFKNAEEFMGLAIPVVKLYERDDEFDNVRFDLCRAIEKRRKVHDNFPDTTFKDINSKEVCYVAKISIKDIVYYVAKMPIKDPYVYIIPKLVNCCIRPNIFPDLMPDEGRVILNNIARCPDYAFYWLLKSKKDTSTDDLSSNSINYKKVDPIGIMGCYISCYGNLVIDFVKSTFDRNKVIVCKMIDEFIDQQKENFHRIVIEERYYKDYKFFIETQNQYDINNKVYYEYQTVTPIFLIYFCTVPADIEEQCTLYESSDLKRSSTEVLEKYNLQFKPLSLKQCDFIDKIAKIEGFDVAKIMTPMALEILCLFHEQLRDDDKCRELWKEVSDNNWLFHNNLCLYTRYGSDYLQFLLDKKHNGVDISIYHNDDIQDVCMAFGHSFDKKSGSYQFMNKDPKFLKKIIDNSILFDFLEYFKPGFHDFHELDEYSMVRDCHKFQEQLKNIVLELDNPDDVDHIEKKIDDKIKQYCSNLTKNFDNNKADLEHKEQKECMAIIESGNEYNNDA